MLRCCVFCVNLEGAIMSKNAVLIDTSVLIHEPTSFLDFIEEGDVLIPIYVIMELDVLKDKKSSVSLGKKVK